MNNILIILNIILIIVFGILLFQTYYKKKDLDNIESNIILNQEILEEKNHEIQNLDELERKINLELKELSNLLNNKNNQCNDISIKIKCLKDEFKNLNETLNNTKNTLLSQAQAAANSEYENYITNLKSSFKLKQEALEQQYLDLKVSLEKEYDILVKDSINENEILLNQIKKSKEYLEDLENKQLAYIKEQQHKEEIQAKKDYYRLNLSQADENDILLLRDLQNKISKKESIDKIIWEIYYKPAYDVLMSHLFNDKEKNSGIYKITCLNNDKAYIGQSVNNIGR